MKKTIKSIVAMLALSSILFTSCDDKTGGDQPPVPADSKVTITLNGGTHKDIAINQFPDTIKIEGSATISGDSKITKLEVRRSIQSSPGEYKVMAIDSTLNSTAVTININDRPDTVNLTFLNPAEKITYLVLIKDSKGKITRDSVTFVVQPLASTLTSIVLGASSNNLNRSKFLGYANNFQTYSLGTDSTTLDPFGSSYRPARSNSDKIDFVFYSNIPAVTIKAAIYSPDFDFTKEAGATDFVADLKVWPVKRSTKFIRLGNNLSVSQFNNPSDPSNSYVVEFIRGLKFDGNDKGPDKVTPLSKPVNKLAKLLDQEVIAFKTQNGKVGLMLIAVAPTDDTNGTFQVQIKMAP